jgi:hypothetical protein
MTGAEHYAAAEKLLEQADEWLDADWGPKGEVSGDERLARRDSDLTAALVHATLAVAAGDVGRPVLELDPEWGEAPSIVAMRAYLRGDTELSPG